MTNFRHVQQSIALKPGELWAAAPLRDSYRDTAAENILAIVQEIERGVPWRNVVAERYALSQPWLHQIITSHARDLFFRQYPPLSGSKILDIGAGWGQIALALARRSDVQVTALEPTPERIAFIRAAAAQEKVLDRMDFIQADFLELNFEPVFDLACCVGVLEWVPKFRAGEPRQLQIEFLRRMRSTLRPGGKCCVGIENRLGLKYVLGGRDDHTSQHLVSVFDAELAAAKHLAGTGQALRVFTYTHAEYALLFSEAGFTRVETYAAYPDYKLAQLILPFDSPAEINKTLLQVTIPPEHDGVDGHLLPNAADCVSHYRSLARMGVAHFFCPSFFFILQ